MSPTRRPGSERLSSRWTFDGGRGSCLIACALLWACSPTGPRTTGASEVTSADGDFAPQRDGAAPPEQPRDAAAQQKQPQDAAPQEQPQDAAAPEATGSAQHDSTPETFRAQWDAVRRRTGIDHDPVMSWRISSSLELSLLADNEALVVDRGEIDDSHLDRQFGHSSELTRWTTSWRGTWKQVGGELRLRLRLRQRDCEREETRRPNDSTAQTKERLPCPEPQKHLELACSRGTAAASPVDHPASTKAPEYPAWICNAVGAVRTTNGSPLPWVLGTRSCLEQVSMRHHQFPRYYRACRNAKSPPQETR